MSSIRVMLAEDVELLRKGFKLLLGPYHDIEIVAEAPDGLAAVDLAGRFSPNVVLMDLSMPRMDGPEAIAEIKRLYPEIGIIALTAYSEPDLVEKTLKSGADGYLLKNVGASELARAIRIVAEGGSYMSPSVSEEAGISGR